MSFDYGQRHHQELDSAAQVARHFRVKRHIIVPIDLRVFGTSSLTSNLSVPKGRSTEEMETGIPNTYVPARNTIMLSFSLAWAEVLEASDVFLGVNALDYSGYPDCRPAYIESFERMANLATAAGVEGRTRLQIHVPLIEMTKGQIVRKAVEVGVPLELTHSCYDPDPEGRSCGTCDSCLLRLKGFREAGVVDPIRYR
jgi:7-cyano-7-deazaguanine synthase